MAKVFNQVSYGLTQGLINEPPTPILAKRAPKTSDVGYQLGTLWIYAATNQVWILASVISNSATWVSASGGSGSFSTLTVSGISTLTGNVTMGGTLQVSGNINTSTGNITAATGNVIGIGIAADGDAGGTTSLTTLTNVTAAVAGNGALTILSSTGSTARTNAGFIKIYVGTTVAYIPYYTQID